MRKHWAYFLLALVLIQTGIAGSVISVSHTRDREHLSITCRLLSENDTVSQINWEMISSPNHTTTKLKLGTFHPVFAEAQESEDAPRLLGERTLEQWALLVGGSTICILSIVTSLYYCWKYCCRHCCHRRRMFEVEAYLTDQHTESEGVTEDPPKQPPLPPPPQPQPQGFDPSKLYAKIKLDLLYGRLWKAYQGTATTWGPTTQHGPQQGPQQVAEPGPQKREEPEESVLQLEPELELEPEHQPALEGREEPVTEPETESELIPPPTLDPGTQMEEMESDTGL
ncbi:protein TsetseEP-like isoform X2 [Salvelinus fontinalis]|uniref:protein TsetseEP-like isoform X2 n=1 Tax=Salvelinus fontinalis TaxID=8038 RepID=UPI002485203E|nr:protein TsetseEP-like isoform X2 [Salvelinus fontinalis]